VADQTVVEEREPRCNAGGGALSMILTVEQLELQAKMLAQGRNRR
jgi:hypothetical protein